MRISNLLAAALGASGIVHHTATTVHDPFKSMMSDEVVQRIKRQSEAAAESSERALWNARVDAKKRDRDMRRLADKHQ